jgi:ribonuclease HI
MNLPQLEIVPRYVLKLCPTDTDEGQWRFVLSAVDGTVLMDEGDTEPEDRGERLELLSVLRGLEALDQPSHVTVFTSSRYVRRGLAYGIGQWRRNGWTWEHFGEMVPIKNRDLWQRLDNAMRIHHVECGAPRTALTAAADKERTPRRVTYLRHDPPHESVPAPHPATAAVALAEPA